MPDTLDRPVKLFKNPDAWTKWLDANHAKSPGLWLRIAKKGGTLSSVTYPEALDVALCYGWIDGQKRPYDDVSWLQRFTPRTRRSIWSKINTEKVAGLITSGRMRPAGLAAVEAARADGRWESAYSLASDAAIPAELQAALDAHPRARTFFATLRGSNRNAVIFRVHTAKKPETRTRRIADFIAMLEKGETVYERVRAAASSRKVATSVPVKRGSRRPRSRKQEP